MKRETLWRVGGGILVLLVGWSAWQSDQVSVALGSGGKIERLETAAFNQAMVLPDLNRSYARAWGISAPPPRPKTPKGDGKKHAMDPKRGPVIVRKGMELCDASKHCVTLMGIYEENGRPYIVLYDAGNKRHPVRSFGRGDILPFHGLRIAEIEDKRVRVVERNVSREWIFRFFDVNRSEYRPKDINESHDF
jgi:hypothetical protein